MPATAPPGEGSPPHFNRTRDNLPSEPWATPWPHRRCRPESVTGPIAARKCAGCNATWLLRSTARVLSVTMSQFIALAPWLAHALESLVTSAWRAWLTSTPRSPCRAIGQFRRSPNRASVPPRRLGIKANSRPGDLRPRAILPNHPQPDVAALAVPQPKRKCDLRIRC